MKFKTLKRWINGQLKNAAQSRDEHGAQVYSCLEPLYREACELQRVKEEHTYVEKHAHTGYSILHTHACVQI